MEYTAVMTGTCFNAWHPETPEAGVGARGGDRW